MFDIFKAIWILLLCTLQALGEEPTSAGHDSTPADIWSIPPQGSQIAEDSSGGMWESIDAVVFLQAGWGSVRNPMGLIAQSLLTAGVPKSDHLCLTDNDCGWHAKCDVNSNVCASLSLGADLRADCIMAVLAFIVAGISLAAGIGGGGLNVPLVMAVLTFDAHVATALSQAMLTGGAMGAFIYNYSASHPARPQRPLINFELASLIGAAVVSGAQVGGVIHATAPPALILLLLCTVLTDAAIRGTTNAIKMSQKESTIKGGSESADVPSEDDPHADIVWQRSAVACRNLVLFWVLVIGLIVGKNLAFSICSTMWWVSTGASVTILGGLTFKIARNLSEQDPVDEHDLDFAGMAFPLARNCLLAGCLAALCGIGGGMVIGPILIDMKVPPPVVAATTATTLLVLASCTCLVYTIRGTAPWRYALLLSSCAFLGAGVGKHLIGRWVKRTGRQSIIVWLLAGITILSTFLMAAEGAQAIIQNGWSAFHFRRFCHGAHSDLQPQKEV